MVVYTDADEVDCASCHRPAWRGGGAVEITLVDHGRRVRVTCCRRCRRQMWGTGYLLGPVAEKLISKLIRRNRTAPAMLEHAHGR